MDKIEYIKIRITRKETQGINAIFIYLLLTHDVFIEKV